MHNSPGQSSQSVNHLQEVNYMYRCLVEHSPDAIVLHHNDQFLYANPAAIRLFGAETEDALLSHSLLDFIPKDCQAEVTEIVDKLQNKGYEAAPISLRLLKLDGAEMEVEVTATAVMYGGRRVVQGMMREVTEQKFMQELQSLNQEWTIFRQLIRHLADRTLNPLAVIRGFLELLKEGNEISVDLLLQEATEIDKTWNRLIAASQDEVSNSETSPLNFLREER